MGHRARGRACRSRRGAGRVGQSAAASRTSAAFLKVTTPLKESEAPRSRQRRASSGPPVKQWTMVRSGTPAAAEDVERVVPGLPGVDDQGQAVAVGQLDLAGEGLALHGPGRMVVVVVEAALPDPRPPPGRRRSTPRPGTELRRRAARRASRPRRPRRGGGARSWPRARRPRRRPPSRAGASPAPARPPRPRVAAPVPTQTIRVTPGLGRPGDGARPGGWRAGRLAASPQPVARRTPPGDGSGSRTTRRPRRAMRAS